MSYSAGGASLKHRALITTPLDLLNAVILQIDNVFFISGSVISDGLYNGEIDLWIQRDDGSYAFVVTLVNGINQKLKIMDGNRTGGNLFESNEDKYPYSFQIRVGVKATLGSASIVLDFI